MSKASGTVNLKAMKEAAESATTYITDIDNNGIFVHPNGGGIDDTVTPTGWRISNVLELLRSGVSIIKAWIENGVAKFRIGKEDNSHFLIEDGRIVGYKNANDIYFETGNGNNMITLHYISNGSDGRDGKYYYHSAEYTPISVYVNNQSVSFTTPNPIIVQLESIPSVGTEVKINYSTNETSGVTSTYFTFGTRDVNSSNGVCTSSFGNRNKVSGVYSFANGVDNTSTGYASFANGVENTALGSASYAGGHESVAIGTDSLAYGCRTKATESYSLACGIENDPEYNLFSVGRVGTGNGFAVETNGDCTIGGQIKSGYSESTSVPMFIVRTHSFSGIGIGAGRSYSVSRCIKVDGYTPIALLGYTVESENNAYSSWCIPTRCLITTSSNTPDVQGTEVDAVYFYLWNQHPSQQAVCKMIVRVLYINTNALNGE